jgi:hypothetical protein
LALSLVTGKQKWFAALSGLLLVNNLAANPIMHGTAPLHHAELRSVLEEDNNQDATIWIAFSNLVIPQYLKAQGATVWNGVRFISNPDDMKVLDPALTYQKVWYRYAHFAVEPASPGTAPVFELKNTDVVLLSIDACSDVVRKLGVNRFAFMNKPDLTQMTCLVPLRPAPVAGLWLYKRIDR